MFSCVNKNIPKKEYEIIIVNDGSPDGSQAIAEQYVEKYSNIKLINQENGGLSVARNNGLKVAQGKYVWYVDSDDWIAENCLLDIKSWNEWGEGNMMEPDLTYGRGFIEALRKAVDEYNYAK